MAINSKQKGKRGELEFAHLLEDYGFSARRGQQYSGTETTADIISDLPHHFEVKRVKRLNLSKAMKQAIDDSGGNLPVVAHRKNNENWLITIRFEDWIKDMQKLHGK